MTLEERLQGEWLCCVDGQRVEDAWWLVIHDNQCNFDGAIGTLVIGAVEALLEFADGDRLAINRPRSLEGPAQAAHSDEIPVVLENDRGKFQAGWMFRPGLSRAGGASIEINIAGRMLN